MLALVILRPFLYGPTSCASYLFGCTTHRRLAVIDPHEELVEDYLAAAREIGSRIVGVLMNDTTYSRWVRLDQYGMMVVLGLFFVFQDEFSTFLGGALDGVTRVMDVIVGS